MSYSALPESWFTLSRAKYRDVLSELDVLLRALDRFFIIEHIPVARREELAGRNFSVELSAARDVVHRVLGLLEAVIPEGKRNAYWFQKFAAAKYLDSEKRDAFRKELFRQDTPEKSLLLLYDSFINLKGIVSDILKAGHISNLTFSNIGQLVAKDVRENVYFSPFRKELNPDFDMIENREISRLVRSLKDRHVKKYVSVLLLHLFRFLRFLRMADGSAKFGSLHTSVVVLLLLKPEITLFRMHLEKAAGRLPDGGLKALAKSLPYFLTLEARRVFDLELREAFAIKSSQHLRGKIENSHGILKNLAEQTIIQIAQAFDPGISGGEIFESFTTKLEQSLRLREDMHVLQKFLALVESRKTEAERRQVLAAMRNFMLYFQSFTFRMLRYDDYEEFSTFFDRLLSAPEEPAGKALARIMERINHFRIFAETCLKQLANRAELIGRPLDQARVKSILNQYLH